MARQVYPLRFHVGHPRHGAVRPVHRVRAPTAGEDRLLPHRSAADPDALRWIPDDVVDRLLLRVSARVDKLLFTTDDDVAVDDDAQTLLSDQAAAVKSPLLGRFTGNDEPKRPRCSFFEGYSLHADLAVQQSDRKKLERLLRYGLRPPFAQKRLSLTPDGKVRLKLRKPYFTGQTRIVLEPLDFLRRLIATIPPRRMDMVRFHCVFAPRAKVRPALQQLLPQSRRDQSRPVPRTSASLTSATSTSPTRTTSR